MAIPLILASATVSLFIRRALMALATGTAITAVQNIVDGTFRRLVEAIRDDQGLTEEEAKDVVSDIMVDLAVNSVTIGGILKTKLPVKTAEWLGFTSKGYGKRKMSVKATAAKAAVIGKADKTFFAKIIANVWKTVSNPVNLFWLFLGFTQFVEQGVYQAKTANDQYERFTGVRPFAEKAYTLAPANFQADTFAKYAQSLETAGIKGFNDPVNRQSRLYSREDLAAIVDWVYGSEILNGKTFSDWRQIVPLVTPYLIGGTSASLPSSTSQKPSTSASVSSDVRVFAGIVSQGTLGAGLQFTPRPDDLIESMDELHSAMNNNIAPYLASLLSKIVYEIKVVPSVIIDNLTRKGEVQQITTGYTSDGRPKTKFVVNKFAVADIFVINDKGNRTKVKRIVLGPTDAVKFQPDPTKLSNLAQVVSQDIVSTNTDDIKKVATDTPTEVVTKDEAKTRNSNWRFTAGGSQGNISSATYEDALQMASRYGKVTKMIDIATGEDVLNSSTPATNDDPTEIERLTKLRDELQQKVDEARKSTGISSNVPAGAVRINAEDESPLGNEVKRIDGVLYSLPTQSLTFIAAQNAKTLSEFYSTRGQSLPSLSKRGEIYESLGLGKASYYTGTSEQNTRLLNALKG